MALAVASVGDDELAVAYLGELLSAAVVAVDGEPGVLGWDWRHVWLRLVSSVDRWGLPFSIALSFSKVKNYCRGWWSVLFTLTPAPVSWYGAGSLPSRERRWLDGWGWCGGVPRRPVSRVLYPAFWEGRTATIYLGPPLPTGSSGQPGDGPDSLLPLLGLAPDGVCLASDVTTGAVSSYLAFSPLPAWIADAPRVRAVCFCSTFRRVAPPRR